MNQKLLIPAVTVLFLAGYGSLGAQMTRADSVRHRNNCRLARQVITTGVPADRRGWALAYLRDCGAEGGSALAQALGSLRYGRVPDVEALVFASGDLSDRSIADTALAIASDAGVPSQARIQALRVLNSQLLPGSFVSYEELAGPTPVGQTFFVERPSAGAALLPAFALSVKTALDAVVDGTTDPALKSAAGKVADTARGVISFRERHVAPSLRHPE
jgi:hypothetical protein